MEGAEGSGTEGTAVDLDRLVHDLLQSVAIVQAVVGLIRHDSRTGNWTRDQVELIERETQTIVAICQGARSRAVRTAAIDLAEVVATVVERVSLVYPGRIQVATVSAVLGANEVGWTRAVTNLVDNACRAAGPDGEVAVEVTCADDEVRVAVGDSGPGFGRGLAGSSSLGLATVSEVVERHGGHLELRASPLGGAEVIMVAPNRPI